MLCRLSSVLVLAVAVLVGRSLSAAAPSQDALACWDVAGDFGRADGTVEPREDGFSFAGAGYRVETAEDCDASGIRLRRTRLVNTGAKPIAARCLLDRFPLPEGDWEVYTQLSYSQNESRGAWQPLHTGVTVHSPSLRSCDGAAPMLALWNRQTGRGRVFHLLTDSAYLIQAVRRNGNGRRTTVLVETGMDPHHLNYVLQPGEAVSLPEVLTYEFANRTDLDCHRLHAWWNRRHPGRRPPSVYNTWLSRFDKLTAEDVLRQVPRAKELGLDYFVIDAGWYGSGKGRWSVERGDWEERPDGRLGGRLPEIAAAVRAAGMGFGLWLEPAALMPATRLAKEHPEWILPGGGPLFDFTNRAAVDRLTEAVTALVGKYKLDYLKFDFNLTDGFDPTGRDFTAYNAAYRAFVREIRRRHPGIYVEGCASGGYMMDLGWARDFDSFWLSDNQGPRAGVRIAKETMLRLPPRCIDRWIVARSLVGVQPDNKGRDARLLATDDSTWTYAATYSPEYVDAFATGGPLGFSCDLTAFSSDDFAHLRELVAERRRDGEFWRQAVGRILCDAPGLVVFQYSDERLADVRCLAVCDRVPQTSVRIHPVLDPAATYDNAGTAVSGADLMREGVELRLADISASSVRFKALEK